MKKNVVLLVAASFLLFFASPSVAVDVTLYSYAFNHNGTISYTNPDVSLLGSDGLGLLSWSTSSAGAHSFIAYFDYEIDREFDTFFNEFGEAVGTPAAGQSWEIDDPALGDIQSNVVAGALDGTNSIPFASFDPFDPFAFLGDVSFALGWDFVLDVDETATITLEISDAVPTADFYLVQTDGIDVWSGDLLDPSFSIYYSGTLEIGDSGGGGQAVIPEPSTYVLFGFGLAGLIAYRRKKK